MSHFFPCCFQVPSLSFQSFIGSWCIYVFEFILEMCWASWMCRFMTFTKFGKYLAIISSNILPDSLSLSFLDSHVYVGTFDCGSQGPLGSVHFFILFFFLLFRFNNFIVLSSIQWFLLNMLLNFSRVFHFSYCTFGSRICIWFLFIISISLFTFCWYFFIDFL